MKKRFLVFLMALTMATTSLVGCSFSIGNESSDSSILDELKDKEDKDKDEDEDKNEDKKENKKEKEEKEDKNNKKDKNDKKDKDEKEDVDWSKAYDDYFEQFNFEDGLELSATTTESGVDIEIAIGVFFTLLSSFFNFSNFILFSSLGRY